MLPYIAYQVTSDTNVVLTKDERIMIIIFVGLVFIHYWYLIHK